MVCFIGIDLGTSKSGYSYAFSTESGAIKIPTQFTPDDEVGAPKTETALLFEVVDGSTWSLVSWGTSAVNKYKTSKLSANDDNLRLVTGKQFKLALADHGNKLPPEYRLPEDCPFSAPELLSLVLQCLRLHAAQHLQQSVGVDIDTTEVHYCLSVPAGWSLKAKRIMHYAAEQAGMKLASRNTVTMTADANRRDQGSAAGTGASAVVLIHEQEAAALTACRDPCKDVPNLKAIPGQVWLILDAGGGTVDIAMHRIEQSSTPGRSQLSEVLRAACLLQGSTRLDQKAEELLKGLFDGVPWEFERWKKDDPQGYISQLREWELVKMKFGGDGVDQPVHLKLEYSLIERLPPNVPGVQHGRLRIEADTMRQLVFDPVIEPILQNVHHMLSVPRRSDGGKGADVLIMAGGFGSNGYLRKRVVEVCGDLLKQPPVTPANASRSVVYGNTIHLQQPDAIVARVSRMTYGVGCGRHPTPQCAQHGHTTTDKKGQVWCDTHFWPLVKVDEVVKLGDSTQPFTVYPMPGATRVKVPIYATESADASHITEPGMLNMGVLEVEVLKRRKSFFACGAISSDNYKIELTFQFGAAEMQVKAFDVVNECYVQASVDFSSEVAAGTARVTLPGA